MQVEHQGLVNGENNWVSLAFLGRERQNVQEGWPGLRKSEQAMRPQLADGSPEEKAVG